MKIAAWFSRETRKPNGAIAEWESCVLAPHVQLAGLYWRRGKLMQEVEKIDQEISRLQP